MQSDTLSSYPLQITKTTASIGEIMNTMAKNHEDSANHDKDKVYSQNAMGEMINTHGRNKGQQSGEVQEIS